MENHCDKYCLGICYDILKDRGYRNYGFQYIDKANLWQRRVIDRGDKVFFNVYEYRREYFDDNDFSCKFSFEFDMCYECFDGNWIKTKIYGVNSYQFNEEWLDKCESRMLLIHDLMVGDQYGLERMVMGLKGDIHEHEY